MCMSFYIICLRWQCERMKMPTNVSCPQLSIIPMRKSYETDGFSNFWAAAGEIILLDHLHLIQLSVDSMEILKTIPIHVTCCIRNPTNGHGSLFVENT